MPKKKFISDERMLHLIDWSVKEGVFENETECLAKIGFPRGNITLVRKGELGFTKRHIHSMCEVTGASADYIFGFTNSLKRKPGTKPMDALKEAVMAVEQELRRK